MNSPIIFVHGETPFYVAVFRDENGRYIWADGHSTCCPGESWDTAEETIAHVKRIIDECEALCREEEED